MKWLTDDEFFVTKVGTGVNSVESGDRALRMGSAIAQNSLTSYRQNSRIRNPGFFLCFFFLFIAGCSQFPISFSSNPSSPSILPTPTPSPIPPTPSKKETKVDVLWVKDSVPPEGGTSPLNLKVQPAAGSKVGVSFYESTIGGSGSQWRASGWMAVVLSSFLLGEDINKYDFSMGVEGEIDGPSAGGIMTASILSLLRGDTIKTDVAMTGTINPDGTIGPVGGIAQKLEGAQKQGKKLVLVPLGQLSGEVLEKKQKLGIEVREVGDIYEAYEALIGKPIPKPIGSIDEQPSLSATDSEKVKAKVKEWQGRYQEKRADFIGMSGINIPQVREQLLELAQQAEEDFKKSNNYFNQGEMAGAYAKAQEATASIASTTELARLFKVYADQGEDALKANLQSLTESTTTRVEGMISRLKTVQPKSASDALALTEAYGNMAVAIGLVDVSKETFEHAIKSDSSEEKVKAVFFATVAPALSNLLVQIGTDSLDLGLGGGTSTPPDSKILEGFANILEQAARANFNYFEETVIEQIAKKNNINADAIKVEFRNFDFDYAIARGTLRALPTMKDRVGSGISADYATLGAALVSYNYSSRLVAKYYSLGAKVENGEVVSFERDRALIRMLDFAEKRNRELIALAKNTGNDPILLVVGYESAKVEREGKAKNKINALGGYWNSSLEATLMAIFSGKYKLP